MTSSLQHSTLRSLLKEYRCADTAIKYILATIAVLATAFIFLAAKTACQEGVWAGIKALLPLSYLASASLLAFAANRQIIHTNIVRESVRREDVVRVTHHLLAVVTDLTNRIHYTEQKLYDEKTVPVILASNATTISDRFESLYDREHFQYLSKESTQLIHDLSGSIFGLVALTREMASMREQNPDPSYVTKKILPMAITLKNTGAFESIKSNLNNLDNELRALRSTVD